MSYTISRLGSLDLGWWVRLLTAWGDARCKACNRLAGVCVWHEPSAGAPFVVGVACSVCDDPANGKIAKQIRWMAFEVRRHLGEVGDGLQLVVWTRAGKTVDVEHLRMVAVTFERIERARVVLATKPGAWSLRRDDAGVLWAPWDPGSTTRQGRPLAYRAGRIAASTRKRACVVCKAVLEPGDVVMRPTAPGSTCSAEGWHRDSHHIACVCMKCADQVRESESAEPLPALRLVERGEE